MFQRISRSVSGLLKTQIKKGISMTKAGLPPKQGLYDPQFEHDGCGVGFVVNIKGEKSREIVEQALTVLQNLDHRGACGCEENTGDGAGILIQIPHTFFQDACAGLGFHLTDPAEYGVGMIFLPDDRKQRRQFEKILEQIIAQEGQKLLGWRKVLTDNLYLGDTAKACEPFVRQVFIGRGEAVKDDLAFERKLYVIRRRAENWIHARQGMLASELFGDDLKKVFPIIQEDGSDSAKFDNCLEFLSLSGRSLPHAVMMMIPEPWENHDSMDEKKRAFYEYHSSLMEPWDGPASIAFTDGVVVGAVLDRNGLRPSRYYVTKDDLVIMASEVGVLDVPPEQVLEKRRLQPGRMFLVDTSEGRIVSDEEIKQEVAEAKPYGKWLKDNLVHFDKLPAVAEKQPAFNHPATLQRLQAFGYNFEDLRVNIGPMAQNGIQPVGSMGTDTPLAVLSDKPQLLYNYFNQLFAQVPNPPIDPIRE